MCGGGGVAGCDYCANPRGCGPVALKRAFLHVMDSGELGNNPTVPRVVEEVLKLLIEVDKVTRVRPVRQQTRERPVTCCVLALTVGVGVCVLVFVLMCGCPSPCVSVSVSLCVSLCVCMAVCVHLLSCGFVARVDEWLCVCG